MELKDATVLVVDDEWMLCEIFSEWLKSGGCRTFTAENGAAALRILETERIDLVVTDIRMPVMDGITFVRTLHSREKRAGQYTPKIIFITGFADLQPRDAYDLGVEALLQKPIDQKSFLKVVRKALLSHEELWREPATNAATLLRETLPAATDRRTINFGQGGFCIRSEGLPLNPGPVRFELTFGTEQISVKGQGEIRWLDAAQQQAGVEILSLDNESRAWTISHIQTVSSSSYIPRSCG